MTYFQKSIAHELSNMNMCEMNMFCTQLQILFPQTNTMGYIPKT